jgi:RNA polymerase sigma-70 factor, ECF subfamily
MFTSPQFNQKLREEEEAQAAELVGRYSSQLLSLARSQIPQCYGPRFSAEDIIQSVYRTYFTRRRDGRINVPWGADLWGLLVVITLRKCHNRRKHAQAARRDLRREIVCDQGTASHEIDPMELARLADLIETVLSSFSKDYQTILVATLNGEAAETISQSSSYPIRTVRRVRQRFRELLEAELTEL